MDISLFLVGLEPDAPETLVRMHGHQPATMYVVDEDGIIVDAGRYCTKRTRVHEESSRRGYILRIHVVRSPGQLPTIQVPLVKFRRLALLERILAAVSVTPRQEPG